MRTLVIGDIHGAYKALIQVLERAKYDVMKDKIIFLGDYVDGWSESSEVVEYLIELQEKSSLSSVHPQMMIFIRGNHDVWCAEWLNTGVKHPYWEMNGGLSTIGSYLKTANLTNDSHRKFFRTLHNYYIDEKNRGFVHGGFVSRKGLGYDTYQSDYYWDRDMWQLAVLLDGREDEGTNKARRFRKHEELFIGHTATTNWICKKHYPEYNSNGDGPITVPMKRCNVFNLDTGAGFRGKLTVMDIDSKEYWQSDYVKNLYPDEKGRI